LRLSGDNAFGGLNVKQGVLELTGDNRYATQVEGGTLLVNGSLTSASLPVRAQGELAGSGRIVGDVLMQGRVSPGNSIGTLSVQGDYVQAAGSSYLVELASDGRADRIEVSGKATIEGGALQVAYAPGQYLLGQRFNVINAAGGVAGQFAALEQAWLSPFLKFGLSYAANQVDLSVDRGASFASVARTRNQLAAAGAADRLAVGQGLPQPLTQLFPEQALAALDSLSGEGHASLRSILLDDSRHLREAALVRARHGGGLAGEGEGAALGAWIELLKSGGTLDGDGNAARNEYRGSTTLLGYDYRFDGGWRLGVLAGRGRIDSDNGRLDQGRIRGTQFGVYGGRQFGAFGLSAGVAVARQSVDLDRRIGFDGFADRTRASYDADTRQGFVEGAYRLQAGAWGFEPYAQFAQVRVKSDAFRESGGAAALDGRAAESRVDLSTLGLRFDVGLKGAQQDQSWLSLRGGLARRHAGGELTPQTQVAWRGGDAFSVAGAPLGEDATLVEAGVAARLSTSSLLELNYSGQFADEAHDHGINARYSLRF
jgi:subtilase-type serine protease